MNETGSFTYAILFVVIALVLMAFFALMIPFLQNFNVQVYAQTEDIIDDANTALTNISDANMRSTVNASFEAQKDSIESQTDILGTFFQYSWIMIIVIVCLVIFIFARRQVETGGLA